MNHVTDMPKNTTDIPMRHLQILNIDRYQRDFEVSAAIAKKMQLLVYNSINFFLNKVRGSGKSMHDIHIRATNLPALIACIYIDAVIETNVIIPYVPAAAPAQGGPVPVPVVPDLLSHNYPFSRSVRVVEDYYQRMRKLVTNETSPDFNLTTTDDCGNPYTFITKIADYQTTYRVGFQTVLAINSWVKKVSDAFTNPIITASLDEILILTVKASPSKAPVCAEVNELRSMQFYEDLYCRWRNVVFNCKNLLPSGNELKSDTLMALYYTSLDRAKKEALPCLTKQAQLNRI